MSRVTTVHAGASVKPSALELVNDWIGRQPWFVGNPALELVGTFKFEDPDGEVGLHNMIVRSRGHLYYVPVTWRSEMLPGWADLIGEAQHTVLGRRYLYNAETDPVFMDELRRVIVEADTDSEVRTTSGDVRERKIEVQGNGEPCDGRVRVVRRFGTYYPGKSKLTAKWELDGVEREDILATIF